MAQLATIAPFGFDDLDPSVLLPIYRKMGCQTAQFYRNPDNRPQPAQACQLAAQVGLPFDSLHGLFGPEHDPSSPDESMRRMTIAMYSAEGQLALDLGGPAVIVHPSPGVRGAEKCNDATRTRRVDPLRRSLAELAEVGRRLGVTYLIENVPGNHHFGSDPVRLASLVRELDEPYVRMCFDTGHANLTVHTATALRECLDVVVYMHVHDNDGQSDTHRIPGQGTIEWEQVAQVIAKMPPQMPAMLELFESDETLKECVIDGLPMRLRRWLALDL